VFAVILTSMRMARGACLLLCVVWIAESIEDTVDTEGFWYNQVDFTGFA